MAVGINIPFEYYIHRSIGINSFTPKDYFYVVSDIVITEGRFIDIDLMGQVMPSSYEPHILKVSLTTGNIMTEWGIYGQFNDATDISIDSTGNIYITEHNCIQKCNFNGVFITTWGSFGKGYGEFNCPAGITVDREGNVYVVDTGNSRIQKFAPKH